MEKQEKLFPDIKVPTPGPKGYRRGIYLQQRRSRPVSMLETFDAPLLNPNCIRRSQSTVSLQALQLMNSRQQISMSETLLGNPAHLRETSERVE